MTQPPMKRRPSAPVLVTGATGRIGRMVVGQLIARPGRDRPEAGIYNRVLNEI